LVKSSGLKMRAIGTIRPYRSNGADANRQQLPDAQAVAQYATMSERPTNRSTNAEHCKITWYCVSSNKKKQKMVLAFVYQCGERCDSGCLTDSLLRRRKITQPLRALSTSSRELAAVRTNCITKMSMYITIA
ncbi:hypothetical protein T01_2746, partial [Trichinella spiralis]